MNKIKYIRQAAGLTQEEFAKVLSVSRSTISHYETFKRRPHSKIAYKILKFAKSLKLKITLEDLLPE